ncbi:hypothetical protein D3C72_2488160 [compost metagenome]
MSSGRSLIKPGPIAPTVIKKLAKPQTNCGHAQMKEMRNSINARVIIVSPARKRVPNCAMLLPNTWSLPGKER